MKRIVLLCMVLLGTHVYGADQSYNRYLDERVLDDLLQNGIITQEQYKIFQNIRKQKASIDAAARADKPHDAEDLFANAVSGSLNGFTQVLVGSQSGNKQQMINGMLSMLGAALSGIRHPRYTDDEQELNQQPQQDLPTTKTARLPTVKRRQDNQNTETATLSSPQQRPGSDMEQAKKELAYHLAYKAGMHHRPQ